jgi:hypothetical protein
MSQQAENEDRAFEKTGFRATCQSLHAQLAKHAPRYMPFVALGLLILIFELPDVIRSTGMHWKALRFPGDLLVLVTLFVASRAASAWARRLHPWLFVYLGVLFVFRVDRMIFRFIMGEDPLLYDQVFMMRHLFVLIMDLWSWKTALIVLSVSAGLFGTGFLAARLIRATAPLLVREPPTRLPNVLLAAWLLAFAGSTTQALALTRKPLVSWSSAELLSSVAQSVTTYRTVKRNLAASPYADYRKITLTRKPDVRIFVIESYGRMLWSEPSLHSQHDAVLSSVEARLTKGGFQAVSAFSASSVRGARSWLADATLILGTPLRYESVFRQVSERLRSRPSMVSFFHKQGYKTVLVTPADRPRPGVRNDNPYGYDQLITFQTLRYHGQSYGWGIVPDQFSMGYVQQAVTKKVAGPQFMNFHLVASHAPWQDVPPLTRTFRELNVPAPERAPQNRGPSPGFWGTLKKIERFDRTGADIHMFPWQPDLVSGYQRTIQYDFQLLVNEILSSQSRDQITILLGDHQPPLLASRSTSYDTPVHIIARDPGLLVEFQRHGFTPGLRLAKDANTRLGHGGIFSLLVRNLASCCSNGSALPNVLSHGHELTSAEPGK